MQRKWQFLWLALLPMGTIGAVASGLLPLPWQPKIINPAIAPVAKPETTGQPTATKLSAVAPVQTGSIVPPTEPKKAFGIDVARIAAGGTSVIAGYAKPSSHVTVMADGKPVGSTAADSEGNWVLVTPHKFASLDPKIEIRPGNLTKVAALSGKTRVGKPRTGNTLAGNTRTDAQAPRNAAEVTESMMRRLEKLTKEATTPSKPKLASATERPAVSAGAQVTPRAIKAAARTSLAVPLPVKRKAAAPPQRIAAVAPVRPATGSGSDGLARPAKLTETLPVPVQFVYRKAEFTPLGLEAAGLLLKYFKAKNFEAVSLSGHADERGTPNANMILSRKRLERIERFLRDGGFAGKLKMVAKGETEKFSGIDRSKFSVEDLYQLDRRVEIIIAN